MIKNIDLTEFAGKDISILIKKGDELFNGNLEEKIHSHKIYNIILEQLPTNYEQIKLKSVYLWLNILNALYHKMCEL